jgi:two-component system sensor histidine kinase/response regulator
MPQNEIMIVDDNPANLKLLEDMLVERGHRVRSFPLGSLALASARKRKPDLIVLDINMPEMNGYEVCEHIKSAAELTSIPVIFLSALEETEDKVKAFKSGGADYISRPFRFEEVHARVDTHLALHQLQCALQRQNEHLEETVAARTQELSNANQRLTMLDRSKSDFLNLISHEFRTPLNGLLGVSEIVLDRVPGCGENRELRSMYQRCRQRMMSILEDSSLLTEIDVSGDRFKSAPVSLNAVISRALQSATAFAESRFVKLIVPTTDLGQVVGDEGLLAKALDALIETAVKFSERGEMVRVSLESGPGSQRLIVDSHGRTIAEPQLARFFDLFSIGEALTPGGDLGVRPALAQRILSLFGGSVSVGNREQAGKGLTIWLQKA